MKDSAQVLSGSEGRVQNFPIMLFAVVMGFSGLTIAFQKAHEVFGVSSYIGTSLAVADSIFFAVILFFYSIKALKHKDEVLKEFNHPIRINFFAAISISLLLLSVVYRHLDILISKELFFAGVVLHSFFTLYTISFWINRNFEVTHSNPAWFIPIVGNVIVPVAGAGYIHTDFLIFYFSVGLLFWVVLFTIILYRIIFHHQLAQKFMPTLFILIAPPAVGFLAYLKCGGDFDIFAKFLLNIGIFFVALLLFMFKNFLKLKFFISWWAFTFPMAAITIASTVAYEKTHFMFYKYLSFGLLGLTTLIIALVAIRTIEHMFKKEVCVAEH